MPETLSRRPMLWTAIILLILLLLAAALTGLSALRAQRITGQQTVLIAPDQLAAGQEAVMRAVVQDFNTGAPIPAADVEVFLGQPGRDAGVKVYRGLTDSSGAAEIRFTAPVDQEGAVSLKVISRSAVGSDELRKTVQVRREYKLLLSSDKPLYQPGQTIHVRSLALSAGDLTAAAGQPVEFTVEDPKGNKVFKREVTTSDFGIASVDFRLADEVNTGLYKIVANMKGTQSEKTVEVKPYTLPKFQISIQTDRPWYLPGQTVRGSLQAGYFFGKPVSQGQVTIAGSVYEIGRQQVLALSGVTDEEGRFDFEFDLPAYFVSGAPEVGQAAFGLEVTVVDQANQAEQAAKTLMVAQEPLLIDVIAESGAVKPGVENIIYILVSYPNGAPAQTRLDLTIDGQQHSLETSSAGLAEWRITPQPGQGLYLTIEARDERGNRSRRDFGLEQDWSQEVLLLRPERATYRVGETLHLDVLASFPQGTAYLDIVRAGQTLSTRALEIVNGRAAADIDLDDSLYGTLELHVYKVLRDASLVADTRLVVVDRANDIDIAIEANQESYRPGDPATISFQTSKEGRPLPAAIGLSIVDESVFALQEQEAGLAKLYFLLQAEILEPRYQLHGFSPAWLIAQPASPAGIEGTRPGVAQAALVANSLAEPAGLRLDRWQKEQAIQEERIEVFRLPLSLLASGMGLLGLAGLILSVAALARRRKLLRGLLWAAGGLIGLTLLIGWPVAVMLGGWSHNLPLLLAGLAGLALLAGIVGLAIYAWRRDDQALQGLFLLLAAFVLALPLFIFLLNRVDAYRLLDDSTPLWIALGAVALLLAFYIRGAGFMAEGERGIGLLGMAAGLGVPLLLAGAFLTAMPMGAAAPRAMLGAGDVVMMEAAMPAPAEAPAMEKVVEEPTAALAGQEPPRLRQFFPETLYWNPQVITGDDGRATVELDTVADSITTWRLSALASSQQGDLGNATAGLRVFQDFFVDLDLPLYLTQNDEVSLPVAVFNYLPESQEVRLVVEPQEWFELLDEAEKRLTIASNDVEVVYFRIRAARFGSNPFQVTAWGQFMSDAIVKEVAVLPDGKRFRDVLTERLEAGETSLSLPVPANIVPGTGKVYVKVYAGVVSQVVEGLQGLLRMPFGCFEQSTSVTYPNVLVLDYLKNTGQASPEVQMKAEQFIAQGYQRLLTFEMPGGGFSLFGDSPAQLMLTAYGLMEFSDMSRVYFVDPALIERTAGWLMSQQQGNGSWLPAGMTIESGLEAVMTSPLPVTAYTVWALADAGFADTQAVSRGLDYLRSHQGETQEPYVLALIANAYAAADPAGRDARSVLDLLDSLKVVDGDEIYWQSQIKSWMGGGGDVANLETTALIAYAMLRAGGYADTAQGALNYIVGRTDSFGSWQTTQATILSLKALLISALQGAGSGEATVTVSLNGEEVEPIRINDRNADVVHLVTFTDKAGPGNNKLRVRVEGERPLMVQAVTEYYLPWSEIPDVALTEREAMRIDVSYDRTELAVNDVVTVRATVELLAKGAARTALVDLGVPPGFTVLAEDLANLVEQGLISRFELPGRQVLIYLEDFPSGQPLVISYRLRAKYPLKVRTPASLAYDYYTPSTAGEVAPLELVVK